MSSKALNLHARLDALTELDDKAACMLPSFGLEVDNERTTDDIKHWLSNCKCVKTSQSPNNRPFRPTRLIDLKNYPDHGITVKLSSGVDIPAYACLSYCWGGPQKLVCTSASFKPTQSWNIPSANLPPGFVDTFKVALQLGFLYVWIDSLCIIQDDEEDTDKEILQMPSIYKNASLTICASSSSSCYQGFLHPRTDFSELKLPLRIPGGQVGSIRLDSFSWLEPGAIEPLAFRAWAFQEWRLSPRILEYGSRAVRWICYCCHGYGGRNAIPINGFDDRNRQDAVPPRIYSLFACLNSRGFRNVPVSKEILDGAWAAIVFQYSSLNLTFPGDRLAAISGVATELQELTGVQYLAGLWNNERLPLQLHWWVKTPLNKLQGRPEKARTPSWSWAGIDDHVMFKYSPIVAEDFRVVNAEVSGGFGKVASGSMTMTGRMRKGLKWQGPNIKAAPHGQCGVDMMGLNDHEPVLRIIPDCAGELVQRVDDKLVITECELDLIAVGRSQEDPQMVRGLVLRKEPSKANYTRVALFEVQDREGFAIRDWAVKTITVI
ncbi:HET-domain-containing [Fusarium albosuccineum]|uniref:HET-domain-containing n=1 Tax=Fusarium albosuccineum TaxID=1237068 RepID=A0A8H4L2S5_9HYPO|nr:HET-domain-containing [Fusarium albosuccineum]